MLVRVRGLKLLGFFLILTGLISALLGVVVRSNEKIQEHRQLLQNIAESRKQSNTSLGKAVGFCGKNKPMVAETGKSQLLVLEANCWTGVTIPDSRADTILISSENRTPYMYFCTGQTLATTVQNGSNQAATKSLTANEKCRFPIYLKAFNKSLTVRVEGGFSTLR